MEILKEGKPENEIEYIDSIEIESTIKWITKITEEEKLTILRQERPENIIQITNEIIISGLERPELQIIYTDEIVILKQERPENQVIYIEEFTILKQERPENSNGNNKRTKTRK